MRSAEPRARLPLEACPALVLNADYRPLSYFPLSTWSWQETIKALKQYIPQNRRPPFTRFNVFLRDRFTCQYCALDFSAQDLTFDHVIPRSRGGRTSWTNVVTACTCCNLTKGNRLPAECGMRPLSAPLMPTTYELQERGRAYPPNYLHESWRDFLYWDTELEP